MIDLKMMGLLVDSKIMFLFKPKAYYMSVSFQVNILTAGVMQPRNNDGQDIHTHQAEMVLRNRT